MSRRPRRRTAHEMLAGLPPKPPEEPKYKRDRDEWFFDRVFRENQFRIVRRTGPDDKYPSLQDNFYAPWLIENINDPQERYRVTPSLIKKAREKYNAILHHADFDIPVRPDVVAKKLKKLLDPYSGERRLSEKERKRIAVYKKVLEKKYGGTP